MKPFINTKVSQQSCRGLVLKLVITNTKGSDIDRKFSINNLQKFFYNQKVKGLLKKPDSTHPLPQHADAEIKNERNQGRDLFNLLMKIEKNEQLIVDDFQFRKKKRRRS